MPGAASRTASLAPEIEKHENLRLTPDAPDVVVSFGGDGTLLGTFDTGVAFMAFFLFQFAFADTASTITSGAMVGRTDFKGDLAYSVAVSGFIYPIIGHWIWGPGGWLQTPRFGGVRIWDFAGSTVVHTAGGMVALAGAIVLGPRLGRKFKRDGGGLPPGHDLTIAAIGGVILWFGWYGFNPGSTLSAMDAAGIGRVATNTTLARPGFFETVNQAGGLSGAPLRRRLKQVGRVSRSSFALRQWFLISTAI